MQCKCAPQNDDRFGGERCKSSDTVCMTQEQLSSVSTNKRLVFLSTRSPSSAHQQHSSTAFKPTNSPSPTKQHVLQGFRRYPCPRRRCLRPPEPERRLDDVGGSVLPERHEREQPRREGRRHPRRPARRCRLRPERPHRHGLHARRRPRRRVVQRKRGPVRPGLRG
jgi:hypothetical protein